MVVNEQPRGAKSEGVRELIEGRDYKLLFLPPCSPDLNPIEKTFSKVKELLRRAQVQTHDTLIQMMGWALIVVTNRDARGLIEHCGYRTSA
jgi:transposase